MGRAEDLFNRWERDGIRHLRHVDQLITERKSEESFLAS